MKRITAILAALLALLLLLTLAGCKDSDDSGSSGEKTTTTTSAKTESMTAKEYYAKAKSFDETTDSADMDMVMSGSAKITGMTIDLASTSSVQTKMENNTLTFRSQTESEMGGDIDLYYDGETLYTNSAMGKTKQAMSMQDALAQIGDDSATLPELEDDVLNVLTLRTEGDNTVVEADLSGLTTDLLDRLMGDMVAEATSFDLSKFTLKLVFDKDDNLKSFTMEMKMDYEVEGQAVSMDMTVTSTLKATGSAVVVTPPDDLDAYTEA